MQAVLFIQARQGRLGEYPDYGPEARARHDTFLNFPEVHAHCHRWQDSKQGAAGELRRAAELAGARRPAFALPPRTAISGVTAAAIQGSVAANSKQHRNPTRSDFQ